MNNSYQHIDHKDAAMPTPERTSLADVIQAGREIVESSGLARLTMQSVADRVGVRAPSLYKRVRGRDALIGLIAEATVRDLGERLESVSTCGDTDPRRSLGELLSEFRSFARAHPAGYTLIFAPDRPGADVATLEEAVAPVIRATTALAGADDALNAARLVTAWASGFVSMELAGAFRLDGDVDRAFDFGVARLIESLTSERSEPRLA